MVSEPKPLKKAFGNESMEWSIAVTKTGQITHRAGSSRRCRHSSHRPAKRLSAALGALVAVGLRKCCDPLRSIND
jgi:hypothetical protein